MKEIKDEIIEEIRFEIKKLTNEMLNSLKEDTKELYEGLQYLDKKIEETNQKIINNGNIIEEKKVSALGEIDKKISLSMKEFEKTKLSLINQMSESTLKIKVFEERVTGNIKQSSLILEKKIETVSNSLDGFTNKMHDDIDNINSTIDNIKNVTINNKKFSKKYIK